MPKPKNLNLNKQGHIRIPYDLYVEFWEKWGKEFIPLEVIQYGANNEFEILAVSDHFETTRPGEYAPEYTLVVNTLRGTEHLIAERK